MLLPTMSSARGDEPHGLISRTRQVQRLRALVAGHRRGDVDKALLALCQLERELAVLDPRAKRWLLAAKTSCRRAGFSKRPTLRVDALLVLADVERRLGRLALAKRAARDALAGARATPSSLASRRCGAQATLAALQRQTCDQLSEGARQAACRKRAVFSLRFVVESGICRSDRPRRERARYALAWQLVKLGRSAQAERVFRRLVLRAGPQLKQRALADLGQLWATHGAPGDAASFIARNAEATRLSALVLQVAEGLARQKKPSAVAAFAKALRGVVSLKQHEALLLELTRLRFKALVAAETADRALAEILAFEKTRGKQRRYDSVVADALWDLAQSARKQQVDEPALATSNVSQSALCSRIVALYPQSKAALLAATHLAKRALARADYLAAAKRYRWLAKRTKKGSAARAAALYGRLVSLQRASESGKHDARRLQAPLLEDAISFSGAFPDHPRAFDVLALRAALTSDAKTGFALFRRARTMLAKALPSAAQQPCLTLIRRGLDAAHRLGAHEKARRLAGVIARSCKLSARQAKAVNVRLGRFSLDASRYWLGRGDVVAAFRWATRALENGGEVARDARLLLALLAARQRNLDRVLTLFSDVIKASPIAKRTRLRGMLARWLLGMGELRLAAKQFARLAQRSHNADERLRYQIVDLRWRYRAARSGAQKKEVFERLRVLRRSLLRRRRALGGKGLRAALALAPLLQQAKLNAVGYSLAMAKAVETTHPAMAVRFARQAGLASGRLAERMWLLERAYLLSLRRGRSLRTLTQMSLGRAYLARAREQARAGRAWIGAFEKGYQHLGQVAARGGQPFRASLLLARGLFRLSSAVPQPTLSRRLAAQAKRLFARLRRAPGVRIAASRALQKQAARSLLTRLPKRATAVAGIAKRLLSASRIRSGDSTASTQLVSRADALDDARLLVTRGLALLGDQPDLLCLRGVIALRQNRAKSAISAFKKALALDARRQCARINLAIVALWQGKREQSRRWIAPLKREDLPRALQALLEDKQDEPHRLASTGRSLQ
jgi:hypothetical protein